jgi:putative transposase
MTVGRTTAVGEYYHVFNRGAQKHSIFHEKEDWMRFLFLMLYAQSPLTMSNGGRIAKGGSTTYGFEVPFETQERIVTERFVELISFCLMPNHFHLIVHETKEGGIAAYMQRVLVGYTMYHNARYQASGHVFQGRYKTTHVEDNEQLLYLSSYIHRNPRELRAWKGKEEQYPYSSLQDYVDKNRWGDLLATDIIAAQFEGTPQSNYRDFVRTSGAKELEEALNPESLLAK